MLRQFFSSATAMACSFASFAQDSSEQKNAKPVITASVDVYYRYNFNNPPKDADVYNNYTSFTNSHNSFELGMASVKVEHSIGKVGAVADLGFGKRAEEFSYNDDKTRMAIKQLFVTYTPWANVKVTAGSWATHIGYEVVDAYANRNYSMSYMFSKGPFFHTGVKADFTVKKNGFMVGIANPTDFKSASFSSKYIIAQYSIASQGDKTKAFINYVGGRAADGNKSHQFDVVITSSLSDKFGIGYNGTVATSRVKENGQYLDGRSWWGSALYFNVDPKPWLGLTLREELFNDKNGLTDAFKTTLSGGTVVASTLSANFKISNLTLIPEFRLDNASKEIFIDDSGASIKNTSTVLLAAVYKF